MVRLSPEELAELVSNKDDAEKVIANLVSRFGGNTATDRLTEEAQFAKQSKQELARRTASNLLTRFSTRRFSGWY